MDNTMYVTALDIYRPGDFVKTSPLGETMPTVPVAQATIQGGAIQGQAFSQGGNPMNGTPINFATSGVVLSNPGISST